MDKPIVQKKYLKFYIAAGIQKVMEVFFRFPEKEFSLSDLAKEAGVAKANIGAMIKKLEDADLLKIQKLSKIWRIQANRDNWHFIKSKIIYNLYFIYQSGLVEYLNEIYKNPKAIILFGSFRDGEDISSSDVDIAIESDEFKRYETLGLRELLGFEKEIGRKIQIHQFNRKNIDINVFNNISNGIVLLGFLEVKP